MSPEAVQSETLCKTFVSRDAAETWIRSVKVQVPAYQIGRQYTNEIVWETEE
jgi:hypothetical protein